MPEELMNMEVENVIETMENPIEDILDNTSTGDSVLGTVAKVGIGLVIGAGAAVGIPKLIKWAKNKKSKKINDTAQKVDAMDKLIEENKKSQTSTSEGKTENKE